MRLRVRTGFVFSGRNLLAQLRERFHFRRVLVTYVTPECNIKLRVTFTPFAHNYLRGRARENV